MRIMWSIVFSSVSLPGDNVLCRLLPCPLPSLCFPSDRIPGLVWFGSVYFVTTAGFVADQLTGGKQQQQQQRVSILFFFTFYCCCFICFSSGYIGESGMGPATLFFIFEQLAPRDASSCVCIPHFLISFDRCPPLPLSVFMFRYVLHLLSLPLPSCLGCISLLM